jgi:peroxiredoxin
MLEATCLVGVGDPMPDAPLDVLGGEQQQLSSQLGPRLTVMFFWESDNLYAQDELRDLTGDVVEAFGEEGVRVIGINVGDSAEKAAAAVEAAEATFPNFLDPEGEYFATVATEKLPRTYLLDSACRILWFDLEYSLTTRRQLKQAVEVALKNAPAAKPPGEGPRVATRPEEPTAGVETPEDPPSEPETRDEPPIEPETPDEPAVPAPAGGGDEQDADPQPAPAPPTD